ncbi:mammalian ependymin-related protein 1-like [Plakobranchus ocellatus]|uniref:Mammalian ependymin-related protein 1-like n=1 Tax=Plakobranchus ocellatus TaxID=259542 RepID=A0AAV3YTX9_9GAST|nr:mammalian ependymin-related protein 1-like [Plakobranchus ocellatus]
MHLLYLATFTAAAVTLGFGQTSPEPPKCCIDRQFTVTIGEVGGSVYPLTGNTVFVDGYILLAYDYYKQRVGAETHRKQPDGSEKVTRVLTDFAAKRQYVDENNVCSILAITEPMEEPCLPANASFVGTATFGYGSASLEVNTWEYESSTDKGRVLIRRTFTKSGCVPVVESYYGMVEGGSTL